MPKESRSKLVWPAGGPLQQLFALKGSVIGAAFALGASTRYLESFAVSITGICSKHASSDFGLREVFCLVLSTLV